MSVTSRRPTRAASRFRFIPLAALVFATVALIASTGAVFATTYTTKAAACDGVTLRAAPKTTATKKVTLSAGTRVVTTGSVSGGSWKATCVGTVSGSRWFRIVSVNGKSVKSLYGVSAVYGATGLFRTVTYTRAARCTGAQLRTRPSTSGTLRVRLRVDTPVTVIATVTGSSWRVTCGGTTSSGSRWYRITQVNGKSVRSLYGVTYLYGATGMYKPVAVTAAAGPTITEGIDVSHWQGTIDWNRVRGAGKRFAFIKASQDTDYIDPNYAANRASATAAGLYVGAYHFAGPGATPGDATAEADHFLASANIGRGDLRPVLDLEVAGGLSDAALQAWVKEYLDRIYQRTGVRGVIYVSPSFWANYVGDSNWFAINGYSVLWIAHWTTAAGPTVPGQNWGGYGWTFWQYTSSGSVPGISGRVDLDRYKGSDFTRVLIP